MSKQIPRVTKTTTQLQIPFHDVDAMRVAWHGHCFKYFEIARTQFLQQIGYDYPQMLQSNCFWPVIDCHCRFIRPIIYGMEICIETTLAEFEIRLRFDYLIKNAETGERLSEGYTIQVAIDAETKELYLESPQTLLDCLGVTLE
jgi:acyl-CoA thioester hydrolase